MLKRLRQALSPSMAVALLALFVALGGVGIAATGGNFILGDANTATSPTQLTASGATNSALTVTNSNVGAGSTALTLNVPSGHSPLKVNRTTRVANLNADLLDGADSTSFLRPGVAVTSNVAGAGGVVDVTNTGTTNGVQGRTESISNAGVYGEHIGFGGQGVLGRAGSGGMAIYGAQTGTGFSGYFDSKVHVSGNLEVGGSLSCTTCVPGSTVNGKVGDSDKLDGLDSTEYAQGDGQSAVIPPDQIVFLGPAFAGFLRLDYDCPNPIGSAGSLRITNTSGGPANLFVDSDSSTADYRVLASGANTSFPAEEGGEAFHIQAAGAPGVLSIDAETVHRNASNDCYAQAQGLLTP